MSWWYRCIAKNYSPNSCFCKIALDKCATNKIATQRRSITNTLWQTNSRLSVSHSPRRKMEVDPRCTYQMQFWLDFLSFAIFETQKNDWTKRNTVGWYCLAHTLLRCQFRVSSKRGDPFRRCSRKQDLVPINTSCFSITFSSFTVPSSFSHISFTFWSF